MPRRQAQIESEVRKACVPSRGGERPASREPTRGLDAEMRRAQLDPRAVVRALGDEQGLLALASSLQRVWCRHLEPPSLPHRPAHEILERVARTIEVPPQISLDIDPVEILPGHPTAAL
jgi:hypothetical protein